MDQYEVRVYDHYQTLIYRSLPASLNFAISKVEEYSKDETNSIYINNTHNGENYEYEYGNKTTKMKSIKELESEFEMKRKKCSDELDTIIDLLEKQKQSDAIHNDFSKIRMDLEYNLKMKIEEYSKF
jgi:hypothetical protein